MPYTVARPSPVPLPHSLVVKKGSKRWALTSGVIPQPVSAIASLTYRPGGRSGSSPEAAPPSTFAVSMVTVPPSGIASRAFTTRFMITCSIWPGSALTVPRSGAATVTIRTSSPISRRSMRSRPATRALRSISRGCSACLRLKESSCRVIEAARSAALRICSTYSRRGSTSPRSSWSRSALPRMAVRTLLKSWATPPASLPTASIFCAWRSCPSRARCSVTSLITPRTPATRPPSTSGREWTVTGKVVPSLRTARYSELNSSPASTRRTRASSRSRSPGTTARATSKPGRSSWSKLHHW